MSVDLLDVRSGEEPPDLAVYAFSAGGALIGEAPLEGGGTKLPIPGLSGPQSVRVVVGPTVDVKDQNALAELLRRGAAEQSLRLDPDASAAEASFQILRPDWLCWLRGLCPVKGTLLKRTSSGGVPIDLPVCGAEVEIYEVDPIPILVPKIPIELIDGLRHIVLSKLPPPPPPPPEIDLGPFRPPTGPGPDPSPLLGLIASAQQAFASRPLQAEQPPSAGDFVTRTELSQLASQRSLHGEGPIVRGLGAFEEDQSERTTSLIPEASPTPDLAEAEAAVGALSESAEVKLAASQGVNQFRASLVANPALVRPLLCLIFPTLVTKQLVATATTDECGHFQALFSQGCSSDTPDLYFVAYRRLGFLRIPIYQPLPVACYTHWDYVCGSEVTLYTSSPFAQTCAPCQPVIAGQHWVLVMAVGNTPLSRIYGTGASLTSTAGNVGLTDGGAPFGGLVRLRIEFDNSLRDQLGVMYYRVSWKAAGSGNPYVPLDSEVHRHYSHWIGSTLVLEAYSLGPHVVGSQAALFEIPPALPPVGQWTIPDAVEDTTSAKFPTGGSSPQTAGLVPPAAAGVYKLRIELFDASGNPVDIGPTGIHYVVPTSTDLSGTVYTTDAAPLGLVPPPPVDTGSAFVMRLHVDNNPTSGSIAAPLLNGSVAADACGVMKYHASDTVTLAYTASHPNGFATYNFSLVRGATSLTVPGLTASGAPVGAGSFSQSPSVSSLLSTGCTTAGFAESLNVYGMATDGWSRLGYDAGDLRAFVLAPKN